jgi:hypothetical protein
LGRINGTHLSGVEIIVEVVPEPNRSEYRLFGVGCIEEATDVLRCK